MQDAVKVLLECIGEDVDRGGLKDTPKRVAKALLFMTKGYTESVKGRVLPCVFSSMCADVVGDAVFDEDHDDMVVVKVASFTNRCITTVRILNSSPSASTTWSPSLVVFTSATSPPRRSSGSASWLG